MGKQRAPGIPSRTGLQLSPVFDNVSAIGCLPFLSLLSTGVSWDHLLTPTQILLLGSASRATHIKTEGGYKDFFH